MKKIKGNQYWMVYVLVFSCSIAFGQCNADAGTNKHFCTSIDSSGTYTIGGNPSAQGTPPFTYTWSIMPKELSFSGSGLWVTASDILNDTAVANPEITDYLAADSTTFYLKITDSKGCISYDTVFVSFSIFYETLGYYTYYINPGDTLLMVKGTNMGVNTAIASYKWTPSNSLINPTLADSLQAFPDTSTWYSVTITDVEGCKMKGNPYYHVIVDDHLNTNNGNINNKELILFPNPVNTMLSLKWPVEWNVKKIYISDLVGKKAIILNNPKHKLNVKYLKKGIYFLKLVLQKNKEISRIFVKK